MVIKQNVPLSDLTTIKIGGNASVVVTVTSESELTGALQQITESNLPYRVLGWGSNVIGRDEGYVGVIILNKIPGLQMLEDTAETMHVRVGAGETLDTVVAWTVEMGLSGIESLSAIPGTIGAAPVQNAGAYGQEIGDCLESVEAIDTTTMLPVVLNKDACGFSYRDSIFKHNDRRYVITRVILNLTRTNPAPPFYASLQSYFDARGTTEFSSQTVRDAVIAIRRDKLPSPMRLPNAGSFFKNAIVEPAVADAIKATEPDLPTYAASEGKVKIPSGWLIERAGLRGFVNGPLQVYDKNALVIVNTGQANYGGLDGFRSYIRDAVHSQFGVTLEQEPEEL